MHMVQAVRERGLAPQREQRPESGLPSPDAKTYMLVRSEAEPRWYNDWERDSGE